MRLFHYTTQAKLISILSDGVLLPTDEFKRTPSPSGKRIKAPIWLSTNEEMELAAIKPVMRNGNITMLPKEDFAKNFGLYRIEVTPSSKTLGYSRLIRAMGLPNDEAKLQENVAIGYGCKPKEEWYGIIGTLKVEKFVGIERYQDGKWIAVDYNQA